MPTRSKGSGRRPSVTPGSIVIELSWTLEFVKCADISSRPFHRLSEIWRQVVQRFSQARFRDFQLREHNAVELEGELVQGQISVLSHTRNDPGDRIPDGGLKARRPVENHGLFFCRKAGKGSSETNWPSGAHGINLSIFVRRMPSAPSALSDPIVL
jgi:hypothetical protein